MYAAGVEGQALESVEDSYLRPPLPGPSPPQPRLNPVTDRASLSAVARSTKEHPMREAPMVGGVSPRGEPPWGTLGAREQAGSGTEFVILVTSGPT